MSNFFFRKSPYFSVEINSGGASAAGAPPKSTPWGDRIKVLISVHSKGGEMLKGGVMMTLPCAAAGGKAL